MSVPDSFPPRSGEYRIGIFGSMMDPPHLGHRAVLDAVIRASDLHRILVVPAGIPPHRSDIVAPMRDRLSMAIRAFADIDEIVVSDTEIQRGEDGDIGYTADTIAEQLALPEELGFDDLVVRPTLIVGADRILNLAAWDRWSWIEQHVSIIAVTRPEFTPSADLAAAIESLRTRGISVSLITGVDSPVSSSKVRHAARAGGPSSPGGPNGPGGSDDSDARARVSPLVEPAILDDVLRLYGPAVGAA